uniref:BHLH domain-containing protein n=1 Tax=Lactuca sativa TaxID=4236 RepID=A0A9R1XML1_LACSA|nr:hypothetical protein LSAT_V11C300137140 [Lactuca sativa]
MLYMTSSAPKCFRQRFRGVTGTNERELRGYQGSKRKCIGKDKACGNVMEVEEAGVAHLRDKELELMVRTVKNHHHQEEEEDEEDFISRTTDASSQKDGRRNDQKASSHRSKHSETEQRRRSKINERHACLIFFILS